MPWTWANGCEDGTAITYRRDRSVGQSRTSRYWPYPPSAAIHPYGTPASSASPSSSTAWWGLVANTTSFGTPASRQRSGSFVHRCGRYSRCPMNACPPRPA